MRATRERVALPGGRSFLIRRDDYPNPVCIWNYHPEWEIHYIPEASGIAYVGDYIGPFEPGHLVLTGANLPHNWITPNTAPLPGRDVVLQFDGTGMAALAAQCPEFAVFDRLHPLAARGIAIDGPEARRIGAKLLTLLHETGAIGFGLFLDIVTEIEAAPHKRPLASPLFLENYNDLSHRRHRPIDTALRMLQDNPEYQMQDLAAAVGMAPASFSRLFSRLTGSRFCDYARRLRVWRARGLLTETDHSITDVCFESGFKNLSNFNRYFKQDTGMTPRAFRRAARIRQSSVSKTGAAVQDIMDRP